jgi:hypothetical protein
VLKAVQFLAALSLQIALKVSNKKMPAKLNTKTSSWRLKSGFCQTRQHKTDRLTPNSTLRQTLTTVSFAFSLPE